MYFILICMSYWVLASITLFPEEERYINLDMLGIQDNDTLVTNNDQLEMTRQPKTNASQILLSGYQGANVMGIQHVITQNNNEWINCIAVLLNSTHLLFADMHQTNITVNIQTISLSQIQCVQLIVSSDQYSFVLDCFIKKVVYLLKIDNDFGCFNVDLIKTKFVILDGEIASTNYLITYYQDSLFQFITRYRPQTIGTPIPDYQLFYCYFEKGIVGKLFIYNLRDFPELSQLTGTAFLGVHNGECYMSITSNSMGFFIYSINLVSSTMQRIHNMGTHSRDIFYSVTIYRPFLPYNIQASYSAPEITILTHNYILQITFDDEIYNPNSKLKLVFKKIINKQYPNLQFSYSQQILIDESYFYIITNEYDTLDSSVAKVSLKFMEKRMISKIYNLYSDDHFQFKCFLMYYNQPYKLQRQENKGVLFTYYDNEIGQFIISVYPIETSQLKVKWRNVQNQAAIITSSNLSEILIIRQIALEYLEIEPVHNSNNDQITTYKLVQEINIEDLFIGQAIEYQVLPKSSIIKDDSYHLFNSNRRYLSDFTLNFTDNEKVYTRVFGQYQIQQHTLYTLLQGPDNSITLIINSTNSTDIQSVDLNQEIVTNFDIIEQTLQIVLTNYDEFNKSKSIEIIQCNIHNQNIQLQQSYEDRTFFNKSTVELLLKQSVELLEIKQYSHPFSLNNFYLVDIQGDDKIEQYLFYTPLTPLTYGSYQIIKLDIQQLITIIEVNMVVYNYLFAQDTKGIIYYFSLPAIKQSQIPLIKLNRFHYQTQEEDNDIEFKLIDFRRFEFYKPPGILIIDYKQNTIDVFYIRNLKHSTHERQRIPLFYSIDLNKIRSQKYFNIDDSIKFLRLGSFKYYRIVDQNLIIYVNSAYTKDKFQLHIYDLMKESGNQLKIVHSKLYTQFNIWFVPKAYTFIKEVNQGQAPPLSFVAMKLVEQSVLQYQFGPTSLVYFYPVILEVGVSNNQNLIARNYNFKIIAISALSSVTMKQEQNISIRFELQDEFIHINRNQTSDVIQLNTQQFMIVDEKSIIGSLCTVNVQLNDHNITEISSHLRKHRDEMVLPHSPGSILKVIPLGDVLFVQTDHSFEIIMQHEIITISFLNVYDFQVTQISKHNYILLIVNHISDTLQPRFYQLNEGELSLLFGINYYDNLQFQFSEFYQLNIQARDSNNLYISFVEHFDDSISDWTDSQIVVVHFNATHRMTILSYVTALDFDERNYYIDFTDLQMRLLDTQIVLYFTDSNYYVYNLSLNTFDHQKQLKPIKYDLAYEVGQSFKPVVHSMNHLTFITTSGLIFYNDTTGQVFTYRQNVKCQEMQHQYQILNSFSFGVLCKQQVHGRSQFRYAYYALPVPNSCDARNKSIQYMRESIIVTKPGDEVISMWKYNPDLLDDPIICLLVQNATSYYLQIYELSKDRTIKSSEFPQQDNIIANICADDSYYCNPITINNYNLHYARINVLKWNIILYLICVSLILLQGCAFGYLYSKQRGKMRAAQFYSLVETG